MTFQWNESETAFLMRLWRKHGMAWGVRPGRSSAPHTSVASSDDTPCRTLVLFDDAMGLPTNAAGSLRYHQDGAAQQRDGITLWSPALAARQLPQNGRTRQTSRAQCDVG